MAGGRPRTVSFEPPEMIKLGEQMIKWIEENDPLHVSEWYSIEMFITDKDWETMVKRQEFVGYYEKAKRLIGRKYLDKNSNVREGVSQRWQRVYFKDLKDEENEKTLFDAKAKAAADKEALINATPEQKEQLIALLNTMSKAQEPSDRNTDNNNNNKV